MTRDELMQIGHDAGFDTSELTGEVIALLECVAEHAEAKERTARIEAQQRLADMQELAAKAGLAHRKAEPVAWMWRVADSDWQLESTCPPERPLAIVEPLYTGYMADAYIEAQQRLADLQDLMSKSGLAHRKAVQEAVREVREECAKEFDALADEAEADSDPSALVGLYRSKAASIRERGAPPVAPALCCDGGPQWGHAWDCPTLP